MEQVVQKAVETVLDSVRKTLTVAVARMVHDSYEAGILDGKCLGFDEGYQAGRESILNFNREG